MVGIIDKPRDGIDKIIAQCREAGIRVFMVTGDFSVTAAAIASQIGIFTSDKYDTIDTLRLKYEQVKSTNPKELMMNEPTLNSLLLTGNDITKLEESDWRIVTQYNEIVFARTSPAQKLQIVENLQIDKNVVAVTGDGVNDSPALKQAQIGIAMGGGSEVAMEAAQMVLLDNSFNSLVMAIENGRLVFNNLRKVIIYLLPAGTFAEIVPFVLNIYIGCPLPMSAFQMIVICVLTDVGPSLSMMMEKSEGDLLKKPPRKIGKDRLVDIKLLLTAYFFLGIFESFFQNFVFFLHLYRYGNFLPKDVFGAYSKWNVNYQGSNNNTLFANNTRYYYFDKKTNHTQYDFDQATTDFNDLFYQAQTCSFVTLVMLQTFVNVYVTRTRKLSLFQSLPFLKAHRNFFQIGSQFVSLALLLLLVYLPFINSIFLTRPVPVEYYFYPLAYGLFFVGVDELRKFFLRKNISFFVKTAW